MDFGALPPEINSLRMYSGPGSAPILAAVSAWERLASELQSTAAAYDTVLSMLTDEGWLGPASEAMLAAITPYLAWMSVTGVQAEEAATSAAAAAGAYEAAYAMTVPPPVIAANRAELQMLVATNLIGQNTAAIASAEAAYGEMWAQDAAAMYGYATRSAAASTLSPFSAPPQVTDPAGQTGQAAAVTQAAGNAVGTLTQSELPQLMSSVPSTLQGLSSPAAAIDAIPGADLLADLLNFLDGNDGNPYGVFLNSSLVNGFVSAGYISPAVVVPAVWAGMADINAVALGSQGSALPPMGSGEGNPTWIPANSPDGPVGIPTLGDVAEASAVTRGVTGGINEAALVGRMSVPQSWIAATSVVNHAGAANPGGGWTSTAAAPEAAAGVPGFPGMPAPGMYGHSFANPPRYGIRPTIMGRPPAAG